MKALLFINGEPPKKLPSLAQYDIIGCTDGAINYLKTLNLDFNQLDFVSGDFDSFSKTDLIFPSSKLIYTPCQDKSDFHKALDILLEKGVKQVDIYGGSGGEMDHFLGNLSVAFRFKNDLNLTFYDEYGKYYFLSKKNKIINVQKKLISLYPFPKAEGIITNGLNWELNNETLDIISRIGTRNFAKENKIEISFISGDLLIFIGTKDYIS